MCKLSFHINLVRLYADICNSSQFDIIPLSSEIRSVFKQFLDTGIPFISFIPHLVLMENVKYCTSTKPLVVGL